MTPQLYDVLVIFLAGLLVLINGLFVAAGLDDGASARAGRFNVSDPVIGLIVVPFGTSTPELFVTGLSDDSS
jgi:Ca2+/Na+ antiporter